MSALITNKPLYGDENSFAHLVNEEQAGINPFLNISPTQLRDMLKQDRPESEKKQITKALSAWRSVVPGPFRRVSSCNEVMSLLLIDRVANHVT